MSNTGSRPLKILVVDDERIIADTLAKSISLYGFHTVVAYSGNEAIGHATSEHFDVLLTDVVMPGMNGIQLSEEICKISPLCKVILVSGNVATEHLLRKAHDCGTDFEIFAKPVHPLVIIERLRAIALELDLG